MTSRRIGIFGGTRFIGFHLVKRLVAEGCEVTLFNRGLTRPPEPLPASVRQIHGERGDERALEKFFATPFDAVIDLTAYHLATVQKLVGKYSGQLGHYLVCSTSSAVQVPPPVGYTEQAPRLLTPGTYGGEKALIELFLLESAARVKFTVLRPQGVIGEYDPAHVGQVYTRLVRGLPVLARAEVAAKRLNLLDVHDLVEATVRALSNPASHGKIYNLAGDEAVTLEQFVALCGAKLALLDPRLVKSATGCSFGVGSWHEYDLVADASAVKRELGLRFTPLEGSVRRLLAWLPNHSQFAPPGLYPGEKYFLRGKPVPPWTRLAWRARRIKLAVRHQLDYRLSRLRARL